MEEDQNSKREKELRRLERKASVAKRLSLSDSKRGSRDESSADQVVPQHSSTIQRNPSRPKPQRLVSLPDLHASATAEAQLPPPLFEPSLPSGRNLPLPELPARPSLSVTGLNSGTTTGFESGQFPPSPGGTLRGNEDEPSKKEGNGTPSVLITSPSENVDAASSSTSKHARSKSGNIVDYSSTASVYELDANSKSWNPIGGGSSTLTIFHGPTLPIAYRFVALSKGGEYLLNTWLDYISHKKVSEEFFLFHVKISGGNWKDYGVQFPSQKHATAFMTWLDLCLNSQRNLAAATSNTGASTPTGTSPTTTPVRPASIKVKSTTQRNSILPVTPMSSSPSSISLSSSREKRHTISGQSITSLKSIASSFEQSAMQFVRQANESVLNPSLNRILSRQDIWDSMQVVMYITSSGTSFDPFLQSRITELTLILNDPPPQGRLDENIIEAAVGLQLKNVKANLISRISGESSGARSLAIQMGALINCIANYSDISSTSSGKSTEDSKKNLKSDFNQMMLQLVVMTKSYMSVLDTLLNDIETLKHIQSKQKGANGEQMGSSKSQEPQNESEAVDDVNIWEVNENSAELENNCGSLNQLILKLTSDSNYDNLFLQTLITTYQSFSSPWTLWSKLLQRYTIPPTPPSSYSSTSSSTPNSSQNWLDKKKATAIQLKIIIALKYWLETQIMDFDEDLIKNIYFFVDDTLKKDGHLDMAAALRRVLDNKVSEREKKTKLMFNIPPPIDIDKNGIALLDLFLESDPQDIAQQLTLIEYHIYCRVEATELLNQSWSKARLKHRSPNILALINRSTRSSWWVATMILLADKLPQRVKVVEKIMDICNYLNGLNNFNTLMSFLGGLNLAAVHRLSKTHKKVSNEKKKLWEKFQVLMSTEASCKNYRTALQTVSPPSLPYIGISLTDLTFIEDGNPNMTKGLINFTKRGFIFRAIREVLQYQKYSYNFPIKEPLHTFLLELPFMPEDKMYDLSLIYEPREKK